MSYKNIVCCRLCGSKNIKNFADFGKISLGNNLQKKHSSALTAKKYRLSINNCLNCNHFQLSISVSPKILYKTNYTYLTGVSKSFKDHFDSYVLWIEKKTKLNPSKSSILDIGSNDGTCLSFFKRRGFSVLGVDPAKLPSQIANKKNIKTINNFFSTNVTNSIIKNYGKFDLITSHNVLAHIDDIHNTFKNAFKCLKIGGFFCFEIGYFLKVVQKNLFDTIYHEHLDYHHANPLCKFLKKIGFSIININTNSIQGGSLRILCKKEIKPYLSTQVLNFLNNEKKTVLYDKKYLILWQNKIYSNMINFGELFKSYSKKDFIKIGYGSPTKIVLLIKLANLNGNDIAYVIEDNKLKIGRFLPFTGIKISKFSNKKFNKPLVICVFAWNFFEEIVSKIKNKIPANSLILCPLPKIKIYKT